MRVEWTKVAEDEARNEAVLLSMGFHKKTYGSFVDRVYMKSDDDASLTITDVSADDSGTYRCEIIYGVEDFTQEIILKVQGSLAKGKLLFFHIYLENTSCETKYFYLSFYKS